MQYEGIVIRPPSEARSLILQATFGCSHNKCTFCPTYKGARFRIKDEARLFAEIDEMAALRSWRRVFLADGDALIIPQARLVRILEKLRESLPGCERVGIYGNAKSIEKKSVEELRELRELGLGIIYFGLESGDDATLEFICKGRTGEQMIAAGRHVKESGIALSITVLLGISPGRPREHAIATGRVLSAIDPEFAGALTVMVVPGTPLWELQEKKEWQLPDEFVGLEELALMLEHTHMSDGLFMSNHASNYVPLKVRMPEDKDDAVRRLRDILESRDRSALKPEQFRAL
ncbi:MAG: radical SAM protein [Candidatus Lernaella stagnicola]|nr:radical SAM protein [Candidatus Lernaella stagnicola]